MDKASDFGSEDCGFESRRGFRDVAQMVERPLCMREVGDRCPPSPLRSCSSVGRATA